MSIQIIFFVISVSVLEFLFYCSSGQGVISHIFFMHVDLFFGFSLFSESLKKGRFFVSFFSQKSSIFIYALACRRIKDSSLCLFRKKIFFYDFAFSTLFWVKKVFFFIQSIEAIFCVWKSYNYIYCSLRRSYGEN